MPNKLFAHIVVYFSIGIVLGVYFTLPFLYFFILLVGITSFSFLLKKYFLLLLNFVILGWITFQHYNRIPENYFRNITLEDSYCKAILLKKGRETEKNFTSFTAEIQMVFNDSATIKTSGHTLLYLKKASGLLPNDVIFFKNNFDSIRTPKNPYAFNYASFLANKRIYSQAFIQDFTTSVVPEKYFSGYFLSFREKVVQKINGIYGKNNETDVMKALLLGEKSDLSFDLKQSYAKTGTMHLLAISGLHTGIIYSFFYFFLYFFRFLPYGKSIQIITSLVLLWLYASITGFSASVCRASLMITLFQLTILFKRDADSMHILCLSAFILLCINPNFLFDVGFQLSYSAVLFIVLLFPYFQNGISIKNRFLRFYYHATVISILATLGTLPLTLYYFNSFPTLFLLSNLIITPLFGFIIGLGIIVLVLLLFSVSIPFLSDGFFMIIKFMNYFVSCIHHFDFQIENIYFSKWYVILLYGVLFLFYLFLQRKKYFYGYVACGFIIGIQFLYFQEKINHYKIQEFIVFDSYQNAILGVKHHDTLDIFSQKKFSKKEYEYIIKPYITHQFIHTIRHYKLHDSVSIPYTKTPHIFNFKNHRVWIDPPNFMGKEDDYIFTLNYKNLNLKSKKNVITHRYHISDSIYQTVKNGTFRLQVSF